VIGYANAVVGQNIIVLCEDMDLPIYIPFRECADLSCTEVIHRLLGWILDSVMFFDSVQTVSASRILRRSQLAPLVLNIHNLNEFDFVPL
jgi:hypothetical protein